MALISDFHGIFRKSAFGDAMSELVVLALPFWVAVLVGILVGWAWRPKWFKQGIEFPDCILKDGESPIESLRSFKTQLLTCIRWASDVGIGRANSSPASSSSEKLSSSELETEKSSIVNSDDLKHLHKLFEKKDSGPAWIPMMNKSANSMSYQAWRRDPETGPPQYCSRTVYEDATPEILRDFFWDDEFRLRWDDMLSHAETLKEYPSTGAMVVRWVRKFPFFCSDREYIIGRRMWKSNQTYYCVTKGVPSATVPRHDRPRRVDLYYSSWCIRAVESERDGRMTACEVVLFHHEDMGIPWEIAKLGVRQGMWGAVRKIEPALRAYQKHRATSSPPVARIIHKVDDVDGLEVEGEDDDAGGSSERDTAVTGISSGRGFTKMAVVVGAVALAVSVDRGLLTKALVFGVSRRFLNAVAKLSR